jgi:hypothetical protein
MITKRLTLALVGMCLPVAVTTHCGSSDDKDGGVQGVGGGSNTTAGGVIIPLGGAAGESGGFGPPLSELCGGFEIRDCNPDGAKDKLSDGEVCGLSDVPAAMGGSSTTAGAPSTSTSTSGASTVSVGGFGGTGIDVSAGGEAGQSQGGMAGAESDAAGAGGEGPGAGGIPSEEDPDVSITSDTDPLEPSGVACRVSEGADGPVRVCGLAGPGQTGGPCTSAADCAAELACVGEGEAGVCRRYCCGGAERAGCEAGNYCAPRRLFGTQISVPVCVRADSCSLAEPSPCPEGEECLCKGDTACMVVRGDGTTTCIEPGQGEAGEPCPCAWGHVCSQASGTCLKLCETVAADQCGGGVCQGAATLPESWGVCIDTGR